MLQGRLSVEHHFTLGLLILTASTGTIDAVSYLALDHVFTGNMTGNILFLGFGIVHAKGIPFVNNAVALLGFVAGTIASGRLIGHHPPKGLPRQSVYVLAVAILVIVALAIYWIVVRTIGGPEMLVITFLLAVIMGGQLSAVRPIGNADVTTIVVTNTLGNLARESRLAGGSRSKWEVRLLAVTTMAVGAAVGALLVGWRGGPLALLAAAVIFTAGALTLITADRRRSA